MENKILEMRANTSSYWKNALIALAVGIVLLSGGIPTIVACFKYDYSDELLASLFGFCLFWFGIDALQIAAGFYLKYTKAKNAYLGVTMDEIRGQINTNTFSIRVEDVVSTSVQVCSVVCEADGTPKNMNPGFIMKYYAKTNKYLCLFTKTGKNYYIDCLSSPETAKNTIDSIIAKNMSTKQGIA